MPDTSTLGKRILYALDLRNKKQADLAKYVGIKTATCSQWCADKVKHLKSDNAIKVSMYLGVNLDWLVNGKGPIDTQEAPEDDEPNDVVYIPQYDIAFGCGMGREPTWEEQHTVHQRAYPLSFFQKKHVNPKRCMFCYIEGDSMEPTLYDGDVVLIDTSQKVDIISGKVYAFRFEDHLRIKRLYRNLKGDITVHSDNPLYRDDIFYHDDLDLDAVLIGRVIDRAGSGNL